jgi:hypothetical protein
LPIWFTESWNKRSRRSRGKGSHGRLTLQARWLRESSSCHRRVAFKIVAATGLLPVGHHYLAPSPGSVAVCTLAEEGAVTTRSPSCRWMSLPRALVGGRASHCHRAVVYHMLVCSYTWFSFFHLIPCWYLRPSHLQ